MKYRCPYCSTMLPDPPTAKCPNCGKVMNFPDALRPKESRNRKKAKERIRRDAERELRALGADPAPLARKGGGRVLVVMLILAILGILLVNQATNVSTPKQGPVQTKEMKAQGELEVIRIGLELYLRDCGHYPSNEEGLRVLVVDTNTPGWNGPYISLLKNDPWFNPYYYRLESSNIILKALGPDRLLLTSDDIQVPTNWADDDALF